MAQLTYNTMRFATDNFKFVGKQAMLVVKDPLNPGDDFTHIDKFILDYTQPGNSKIRFAFYSPETSYMGTARKRMFRLSLKPKGLTSLLTANGVWSFEPDIDEVLEYGNTVDDLLAFADWQTQTNLYPVIALEGDGTDIPKVKLSMQVSKRGETLDKEREIDFNFANPVKILELSHDSTVVGDATMGLRVAYKEKSTDAEYSNFQTLKKLHEMTVQALRFKAYYHVDAADGTNSAKLGRINIDYTPDPNSIVFGDSADLYTITKKYFLPLKYCAAIIKHEPLGDATIQAFAKYDKPKYEYSKKSIGTGTGGEETYTLPGGNGDGFIDVNTLKIYVDGTRTDMYTYESTPTETTITLTAASGAKITASYHYNLYDETWIELTPDPTQYDFSDGLRVTRFYCSDVKKYGNNVQVSAIRLKLNRAPETTVTETFIATGSAQSVVLKNAAYNVKFSTNTTSHNFVIQTNTATFTAAAGETVTISYTKRGEVPRIRSFTAGWAV